MMGHLTQSEWARKHGFTPQYVRYLADKGLIQLHEGKIDEEEADAMLASIRNPAQPEQRNSFGEEKPKSELKELSTLLMKVRISNEKKKGDLLTHKTLIEKKELIPITEVKTVFFQKARITRDRLLGIHDRVASLLATIDDQS